MSYKGYLKISKLPIILKLQCFSATLTTDIVTNSLLRQIWLANIDTEIEFAAVKSPDNVTISYCDTFAIPRQCLNIREALHCTYQF